MTAARAGDPSPYLIPLSSDGSEVLSVDTGPDARGWAAYFSKTVTELDALVLLRIVPEAVLEGRLTGPGDRTDLALEVREVRISTGQRAAGFASSLLREIPILRIEAAINQGAHRRHLSRHAIGTSTTAADLPGGSRFRRPPSKSPTPDRRSLAIADPGGYRKPDEFYQQVADLYLHLAAVSARPAHELAAANNVPVATVHRWIREAKVRRILLLPAHRGGADRSEPSRRTST